MKAGYSYISSRPMWTLRIQVRGVGSKSIYHCAPCLVTTKATPDGPWYLVRAEILKGSAGPLKILKVLSFRCSLSRMRWVLYSWLSLLAISFQSSVNRTTEVPMFFLRHSLSPELSNASRTTSSTSLWFGSSCSASAALKLNVDRPE